MLTSEHPIELDHELLLSGRFQRLGPAEYVLFNPRWNAFHHTAQDDHLWRAGGETVVVTGCNFPNCPQATLFGASARDYRAVLIIDAVSLGPTPVRSCTTWGIVTATAGKILTQLTATLQTTPQARSAGSVSARQARTRAVGHYQCMNG